MLALGARMPLVVRARARRNTAASTWACSLLLLPYSGRGRAPRHLYISMKAIVSALQAGDHRGCRMGRGREGKQRKGKKVDGSNPKKEMKARFTGAPSARDALPLAVASEGNRERMGTHLPSTPCHLCSPSFHPPWFPLSSAPFSVPFPYPLSSYPRCRSSYKAEREWRTV
jgi:hypothetical protein